MVKNNVLIWGIICLLSISCNNRQYKQDLMQLNAFINNEYDKNIIYDKRQLRNYSYLDSVINVDNGIVYIANTDCSVCVGELMLFLENLATVSDSASIFIAAQDTLSLSYYLTKYNYSNLTTDIVFVGSKKEIRYYNGLVVCYKDGRINRFMKTPFHAYGK